MPRKVRPIEVPQSMKDEDYCSLLKYLPEGVGVTDLEENLIFVNEAFAEMLGYSHEELIGKSVRDLVPDSEVATLREATKKRSKGIASAYNLIMLRKDGSHRIVRISGVPRRDESGTVIGTMAVVIDVTEDEAAKEELRKLSRAVEQSPASVVITDCDARIEYVNTKFTELTGYTMEEALGKNPSILKSGFTSTETYEELWSKLTMHDEWKGIFINRKKNGDLYWEDAWIGPVSLPDGTVTHYVAVKKDITKQVEIEQLLRDSLRDLELYSSILRHDLRNDLHVLLNHAEAARMHCLENSEAFRYLDIVEGVAERMTHLLDLVGSSEEEERDILRIIQNAKVQTERTNPHISIEIANSAEETELASSRLIPIVFDNLLRNTVEFTQSDVNVNIELRNMNGKVEIIYRDDGPGISVDVKSRLFEKGASTTGGGYGLYLSRKVVKAYGGSIELVEDGTCGATFRIVLPLARK
ncbi:MAG: PAS domain S-box protein [Candidatus Thorarchaeota archaeon]